jgi:hypothetical protein
VESLLRAVQIIPLEPASAKTAALIKGQLRATGRTLAMADALIAGICIEHEWWDFLSAAEIWGVLEGRSEVDLQEHGPSTRRAPYGSYRPQWVDLSNLPSSSRTVAGTEPARGRAPYTLLGCYCPCAPK